MRVIEETKEVNRMNGPAHYFHVGFILISVANLIVILLMILVFILAVVLPFPSARNK
ncbi:MAG: hypothetical protein ACR2JC_05270 [Chloroflexota bacterium]